MNPINITLAGQNAGEISGLLILGIAAALILWLWSIVVIAKTKTEDPYDRIVWLLIVLALNVVGTLLYFFFYVRHPGNEKVECDITLSDADLKRRANEGTLR